SRRRSAAPPFPSRGAGAGSRHRRGRRRSQRHRHLQPGRRAIRLWHGVDAAVQPAVDDRDPGDLRQDRRSIGAGHSPQPARPLPPAAAAGRGHAPADRQRHQPGCRPGRDGLGAHPDPAPPRHAVHHRLRAAQHRAGSVRQLCPLCEHPQMDDPVAAVVFRGGGRGARISGRCGPGRADPEPGLRQGQRDGIGGGAGHHDQPLPVLSAGRAGSGRTAPPPHQAASRGAAHRRRGAAPHPHRHAGGHGLFQPDRDLHRHR
ncbi:hypothetical protein OY671_008420, partial [Metschnikowia pulcherrima]